VGLGAMGSAALYQLAKAGVKVLGLDRFTPPHDRGSTHGDTRITRLAVGEGAEYVPLVRRSHEIWREIEGLLGADLLQQCGGLVIAGRDAQGLHGSSEFLGQTVASARTYGIRHELLSAGQVGGRYPQLNIGPEETGYFEPEAGLLRPERCVAAQLELARRAGATLRLGERVRSYSDSGAAVTVRTDRGTVTAEKVVIAAGPWVGGLVPELDPTFRVYRQVMYWFDLDDAARYEAYRTMPVFIWDFGERRRGEFIYGFPMVDGPHGGAKVATEDYTSTTSPDAVHPPVGQQQAELMYDRYVKDRLPGLSSRCVKATSCLYTVAPLHRFVIDVHPSAANVFVASPCSGHGFKHSAAIGEVLAQLVTRGRSDIDVSMFSLRH
jgi:sarcosine oxidase